MQPGFFITFEGIDGSGKSSQIEPLAQKLREQGREVIVTREPGGTPLGEKLRDLLLHESMDTQTEIMLAFAARREHMLQLIGPALERDAVVICDRFTDSTLAYQASGDLRPEAPLRRMALSLAQWVHPDRWPDLTFWFELEPKVAAQRMSGQQRHLDRFELRDVAFFRRVHAAYAMQARQRPNRFVTVDAQASREDIARWLAEEVAARMPDPQAAIARDRRGAAA